MRILIVEDEKLICEQLRHYFVDKGFAVDVAHNATDGEYMAKEYPIDAAIIDVGLPDFSGIELIKHLRQHQVKVPILILTARISWQEKVEGLDAGADDYVTKPFEYAELLARINALIRRSVGVANPVLTHGDLTINTVAQEVFVLGAKIELTAYEYKVLEYLLFHKGKWISKTTLAAHIYDEELDRDSNVIEVFIGRLRKKIDPDSTRNPIATARNRGYSILADS